MKTVYADDIAESLDPAIPEPINSLGYFNYLELGFFFLYKFKCYKQNNVYIQVFNKHQMLFLSQWT